MSAVRSGADAVYMGLRDFNARRNADNFDGAAFADAVKYCHIRGVKVYLTLNTVLSDSEMPRALEAAKEAYVAGADAVIVQDLGLAKLLHSQLPDFPLHASTQLNCHSPSVLPILKELGFTQVVVSREMSKNELTVFCAEAQKYGIAVEVFVHGALCMCMSGQCYLSAMLGGRSGNRGLCAGPCRLPFEVEGGTGYDLSLKDLSLVDYIDELREIGVKTLKIEGRMKRPEYVAAATAVCRRSADGEDCGELKNTLYKVFSRSGFTDGYYKGKPGKDMFGIRTREDAELSAAVIKSLHELYRGERQSVHIKGEFILKDGVASLFTVSDGANTVVCEGAIPQAAINRPADHAFVTSQLSKTGSTPYIFDEIKTDIGDGLAISAGSLNALRREALDKLSNARYKPRECEYVSVPLPEQKKENKQPKLIARFADVSQIPDDVSGLSGIILPLESNFESIDLPLPLYVDIPRGIADESYILSRLQIAKAHGIKQAYCGNIAAVVLCKEAGLLPVFDFSMNIFNSYSNDTAKALGAAKTVLSAELTCEQINKIRSELPTAIIGYGRLPLMLTKNCPIKNGIGCKSCEKNSTVTDRKDISFPVRCRNGYSELFNSKPIYLAERQSEFNVDDIVLYFTFEVKEECQKVINDYIDCAPARGEYTRGLYYRGVR